MSQRGNTPRGYSLPPVEGTPLYIRGRDALDICRLTGLSLNPAGKFIDVSRLHWVDRLRITLAVVAAHYYCDVQEGITRPVCLRERNQCMGCQADWPLGESRYGFPIHYVDGYPGEIVGCTKEVC